MKKKIWIGTTAAVLIIGAAGVGIWMLQGNEKEEGAVYVSNVASMLNLAGSGLGNRYTGVAETQKSWEAEFQADKEVAEWYVEEGQEVAEGTPLFRYDTAKTEESLAQARLDLETIANDKINLTQQIAALEKAKKEAKKEEQVSYDIEILNVQASLKAKDLEESNKTSEINSMQKVIDTATVSSPIAGIVKSMNKTSDQTNSNGKIEPFVSIVGSGDIRIKGTVNELNLSALEKGASVIIRSRADENTIWKGNITEIDTNSQQNSTDMGGSSGSTKYPFYVELEESAGLMLGQHVLVEMDYGQGERRQGIWLDEFMIADADTEPYVWADDGTNHLEKRKVTLGEYDKERNQYEIQSGLMQMDWITFPEEDLKDGMQTMKSQTGQMGKLIPEEEGQSQEEMMEPENSDDTAINGVSGNGAAAEEEMIFGAGESENQKDGKGGK